jgi:hypothetical protein
MALGLVKANKERVHDEIRSSLANIVPKLGTGFWAPPPFKLGGGQKHLPVFIVPACVLGPEISECGEVHCDHTIAVCLGRATVQTYDAATLVRREAKTLQPHHHCAHG